MTNTIEGVTIFLTWVSYGLNVTVFGLLLLLVERMFWYMHARAMKKLKPWGGDVSANIIDSVTGIFAHEKRVSWTVGIFYLPAIPEGQTKEEFLASHNVSAHPIRRDASSEERDVMHSTIPVPGYTATTMYRVTA